MREPDDDHDGELELESIHRASDNDSDSFLIDEDDEDRALLVNEEDPESDESRKGYPYKVIYENHEIVIDSNDIKDSRVLKFQYIVMTLCFLGAGLSDGMLGAMMPSLIEHYGVNHSQVSYIFSAQFIGYFLSSIGTTYFCRNFGFGGTLVLSLVCSFSCFVIVAMKPPIFWIIPLMYILNGLAAGNFDCAGSLWVGKLKYSNQLMGMIHAAYGLGGMVSPVVLTAMVNHGISWSWYYLAMASLNLCCGVIGSMVFKNETGWKFKYLRFKAATEAGHSDEDVSVKDVISNIRVWFFSISLFLYVGTELSIATWVYNYLIVVQSETSTLSSYITSGYWLSLTLGRVFLGFAIGKWFEKNEIIAVILLCSLLAVLSFIFTIATRWILVQSVAICLMGAFVGPMFPTIAIVAMQYLPPRLETAGMGVIMAFGGGGGAAIPYLIGLVSKTAPNGGGLKWFPLIIYCVLQIDSIAFGIFYRLAKRVHQ